MTNGKHNNGNRAEHFLVRLAQKILRHLLDQEWKQGVERFEEFDSREASPALEDWLNAKEYRDCLFLLAEAYEESGKMDRALIFYEKAAALERSEPLCYFLEVAEQRIAAIRAQ